MGLFDIFKKNKTVTPNTSKEPIDFIKYFQKPLTLFADGQAFKAISFCESNYDKLVSYVNEEKAFAFILLLFFHVIGYEHVPSTRFTIQEAKAKKEENRVILNDYYSNEGGNHSAVWYGIYCAFKGSEMSKQKKEELLKKGASMGDPHACYELAMLYKSNADYSQEDLKQYVYYLQETLKLYPNYSSALNDLATVTFNGQGVEKDKQKAIELYEKAAENDSLFAMFNLGTSYAGIKNTKAVTYLCKYTEISHDGDGIKEVFNICRNLQSLDNPFDLIHCYLYLRVILGFDVRYGYERMVHGLLCHYLPWKPKLFRLIETMVYHSDQIYSFDIGGIVNNDIVARTRHDCGDTERLLADYFNNYLLSDNDEENDKLVKLFDKMFEPIPIERLADVVELYDKAIYAIGVSRVAETRVMSYQFDKTE